MSVVVTGAAAGLGLAVVGELVARGRLVVAVDRDARALDGCAGDRVETLVADLSTLPGAQAAADALLARGDVEGLVNNAGGWLPGDQYPLAAAERWLSALTLDLTAPMLLTQALWPVLATASGAVVNVGSSGGLGDEAYGSPEYGAARAGLRRVTASLGDRDDVRVTAVVPGWVGLERAHRQWADLPDEERAAVGPLVPPERVAGIVCDLLESGRPGQVVELLRGDD